MNVLFLIGSPKAQNSTSETVVNYLANQLGAKNVTTSTFFAASVLRTAKRKQAFLDALRQADCFVITFPVYVDTIPYVLQHMLEVIAVDWQQFPAVEGPRLLCIANCGFPEPLHTEIALRVCEQFAHETDMQGYDGIGFGQGGVVDGKPLAQMGGQVRSLRAGLEGVANALLAGKPISPDVVEHFRIPFIPARMYTLAGTANWHYQARQNGVRPILRRKPYSESVS